MPNEIVLMHFWEILLRDTKNLNGIQLNELQKQKRVLRHDKSEVPKMLGAK